MNLAKPVLQFLRTSKKERVQEPPPPSPPRVQVIPPVLFQTWHNKDFTPGMKHAISTFNTLSKNHLQHYVCSDGDCREFIYKNFNSDVLKAYDTLIPGAYKADLWRYCVLYVHGGIYVDIKFKALVDLTYFLDNEYFVHDLIDGEIYNGFIVVKPKNPRLMDCILAVVENTKNRTYGKSWLSPSGPELFGRFFKPTPGLKMRVGGESIHTISYNRIDILTMYPSFRKDQNALPIKHYSDLWTERNIYKSSISVCLAIRNGETYMSYINDLFGKVEKMYDGYVFEYFIYENNSADGTKKAIENFSKNRVCKYMLEDIPNNNMQSGISLRRGQHMANIRNKLKAFHGELNSVYTLLFDCDVVFFPDTFGKLINVLNGETVMASPFCVCEDYYTSNKGIHYYDTLAFTTLEGLSYKDNDNTCIFKDCIRCIHHRKRYNITINETQLLDSDKPIQVNSCFGSLSLIKTDVYNKVSWGDTVCEHISFCEQVRNYGKIIVDPTIKISVTTPGFREYSKVETDLKDIIDEFKR